MAKNPKLAAAPVASEEVAPKLPKLKKKAFEKELERLQVELVLLQGSPG